MNAKAVDIILNEKMQEDCFIECQFVFAKIHSRGFSVRTGSADSLCGVIASLHEEHTQFVLMNVKVIHAHCRVTLHSFADDISAVQLLLRLHPDDSESGDDRCAIGIFHFKDKKTAMCQKTALLLRAKKIVLQKSRRTCLIYFSEKTPS